MADQTPRLDLDTFAQGDEDWSHTDTVEMLDELAVDRGPVADRPDEGDYDDEMYFAVDQRVLYRWEESESDWKIEGGRGSVDQRLAGTQYLDEADVGGDLSVGGSTTLSGDVSLSGVLTGLVLGGAADLDGETLENVATLAAAGSAISVDAPIDGQDPTAESELTTKSYVDSVVQGLDWQESVIDEQNDPPSDPSDGDRYLVGGSPTGDWDGNAEEIAEWDGSEWIFSPPDEGFAVFIEARDLLEVYQSGWVEFGSAIKHSGLNGLSNDDHEQYLHVDGRREAERVDIDGPNTEAVDNRTVSGTTDLDVGDYNAFRHTLDGDVDYSIAGADEALPGESFALLIEQDGSTQHAVTWPTVEWDIDQEEPDDPETGELLEVVLRTYDGGGTWYGTIGGRFSA